MILYIYIEFVSFDKFVEESFPFTMIPEKFTYDFLSSFELNVNAISNRTICMHLFIVHYILLVNTCTFNVCLIFNAHLEKKINVFFYYFLTISIYIF